MTVLPYIDIKATPILSVKLPQSSRIHSLPRINDTNSSCCNTDISSSVSSTTNSQHIKRTHTPKIKIRPRMDEILKKLPCEKPPGAVKHNAIWKPLVRELPDYDYLWDTVQREDIRHQYDYYITPPRIIPSLPEPPNRMTTAYESQDRHYHNYKRVRAMQQKQWNNEHIQYTIYPYAHLIEREMYNKHIRSTLKDQMKEKAENEKFEQEMKNLECQIVIQHDQQDLEQEKQKKSRRAKSLLQVTARNKELMENKWEYDHWNRAHQWHVERAILADDPINWSKTMT